jgi:hypothetical protein
MASTFRSKPAGVENLSMNSQGAVKVICSVDTWIDRAHEFVEVVG